MDAVIPMVGKHHTRMVGWHPSSADDAAWLDAEIEQRGGRKARAQSALLDEMLSEYRKRHAAPPAPVAAETPRPQRTGNNCKHPKARINKGLCGACGTFVGRPETTAKEQDQ